MIHRLIYVSRSRIAAPSDMAAWTIRSIVAASRTRNALRGITGAMVFHNGSFGQVLEGPAIAVLPLFQRIARDERHGDITMLASDDVAGRCFDGWSMALVGALSDSPLRRQPPDLLDWDRCCAEAGQMLNTLLQLTHATQEVCA